MATLEELVVRIRADASQLEKAMRQASASTEQAGKKMGGALDNLKGQFAALVPAISLAALTGFGKSAIDAAGHMQDLGDRIGFAASTLSALEPSLAASGSSVDDLAASMNLMNNQLGEAAKGSVEAIKAFDQLGLSVEALKQLSPEDQFYAVVDSLGKLENQYEQTEAGRALFGRGFAALIPLIKQSEGNLRANVQQIKDTNDALSDETIARIDNFGDALSNAGIRAKNAFLEAFGVILKVAEKAGEFGGTGEQFANARMSNYGISSTGPGPGVNAVSSLFVGPPQPPRKLVDPSSLASEVEGGLYTSTARGSNKELLESIALAKELAKGGGEKAKAAKQATDEVSDATERFIRKQEEANAIIEKNRTAYEIYMEDSKRATELLSGEQLNRELQRSYMEYTDSFEDANEEIKQSTEDLSVSIRDSLNNAFESAIFDAENFGQSMGSILDGIARQIARAGFIDPLSNGITDMIKGSGVTSSIGSWFGGLFGGHRASGGAVSGGMGYIVGERGPELFRPGTSGNITSNDKLGGVTIVQNFASGIQRAELAGILPQVAAAAEAGVMRKLQNGGNASRLIGNRG